MMERNRPVVVQMLAMALDALVVTVTWIAVTALRHWLGQVWSLDLVPGDPVLRPLATEHNLAMVLLVVPVWLFALYRGGTYDDLRRIRSDVMLMRVARACAVGLLILLGISFALQVGHELSRTVLISFSAASVVTVWASRMAMIQVVRHQLKNTVTHNILVVGTARDLVPLLDVLRRHRDWGISVFGVVRADDGDTTEVSGARILGVLDDLPRILERHAIDEVMVTGSSLGVDILRRVADSCEEVGVRFSMDANFLGLSTSRAHLTDLDGWHVLSFSSTPEDAEALAVKRAMDILFASVALIVLSPVFLVTALAIKLEDGGPIFFSQERSGLYGRTFSMYKFRSMVVDAEALKERLAHANEMDGPVFKMRHDPRITRVGRFIRKTSIDELPQLWNVVRGEMSLVGPRPPLPAEVEKYERWQRRRLSMKPGITCIWQVSGRNEIDFETWMKLDLQYIDNWSLFLDIKLLFRTVPVVLLGTGAS
ncbi:MAG: sugar transferase [Deltaproteobacteria bacterium]|nr:MAG: sugar transferase [Deltaproteobacteria bacterium]